MPKKLSNAEKQRRYREARGADPERRAAYLTKKREKYRKDLEQGKRKSIKEMTKREQRRQRKEWQKNQRAHRNLHQADDLNNDDLTPPSTPENEAPGSR